MFVHHLSEKLSPLALVENTLNLFMKRTSFLAPLFPVPAQLDCVLILTQSCLALVFALSLHLPPTYPYCSPLPFRCCSSAKRTTTIVMCTGEILSRFGSPVECPLLSLLPQRIMYSTTKAPLLKKRENIVSYCCLLD